MLLNLVKEIIQGLQLSAVVNFLQRGFELLPSIWTCIIISCHHCTVMQLERWADALRDYEALKRELPGNVEVARALSEVQLAFKKSLGEETYQMWYGGGVGEISSNDQFRKAVSCSGMHSGQFWVTVWKNFSWFTCTQFQRSTVSLEGLLTLQWPTSEGKYETEVPHCRMKFSDPFSNIWFQ